MKHILLYYEYYIYYLIIILNIDFFEYWFKKSYLNCRIVYQISDSEILKEIHSPETKKKIIHGNY